MKKIIYPIMIILVSCFIGCKWYHNKARYIKVEKQKPVCVNAKNCERCPYQIECYGIDDDTDL